MAGPPNQRLQGRIEFMIRVAAPLLDLALLAGQSVSRLVHRDRREPLVTGEALARGARGGVR